MLTKRFLMTAAVAGALTATTLGTAFAQSQPIVGISTVTTYSIDATITAIDPAKRTITFTGPAGRSLTHRVSDGVKMDTSKVGDVVSIAFEDKLSFVLSAPNARTPRDRNLNIVAGAAGNNRAAGVMADQSVATWWVTAVDPSAGKISVVNPGGGEVRTYNVLTGEGRAQLPRVKPGDNLTAIDTQVLIMAVTPKK